MAGDRVLITGGRGFTGRYVRQAFLKKGYEVFSLDTGGSVEPGYAIANLNDPDSLRKVVSEIKPDYLVHLAAIPFVAHGDASELYKVNVIGTCNLLDAFVTEHSSVKKIILASSANIYGNPPVEQVHEEVRPGPVNHYAMSKLSMEYMAATYREKLPLVIVRPFNYTGIGQDEKFLIPKIIGHFARKEPSIKLGNLDVVREFNDVRMVAESYLGLAEKAPVNSVYNICTGQGHSLLSILELAQKIAGYKIDVTVDSNLVRANEIKVLIGDSSRLSKTLGSLPKYTFEDTLNWMYSATKENSLT